VGIATIKARSVACGLTAANNAGRVQAPRCTDEAKPAIKMAVTHLSADMGATWTGHGSKPKCSR
jgi:hypothetical protein